MSQYGFKEPYYTTSTQPPPATVTPVQTVTSQQLRPWFDPWYLATLPGGLKILQVIAGGGALCAILLINGAFFGTYFAVTACVFGFSLSLILLIMNLYNLVPLVSFVDIPFWSLMYTATWTLCYAASSGIMIYSAWTWRNYRVAWGSAAALCVLGFLSCAADTVYQLVERRHARRLPTASNAPYAQAQQYRTSQA